MTDKIVILTTCETKDEARKLARALVEERVAACVNIVSQVESVYRWKGQVESAAEFLLVIKSSRDMVLAAIQIAEGFAPSMTARSSGAIGASAGVKSYLRLPPTLVREGGAPAVM